MTTQSIKPNLAGISRRLRKNLTLTVFAAGFAFCNAGAQAATLYGTTVDFNFNDSLLDSLFGTFLVNGDSLEFSPQNFVAKTANNLFGEANATTPLITVSAKAGYTLAGVKLFEQGDYYRIESAPNTSFVGASGQFIVNNAATTFTTTQSLNAALSFTALASNTAFTTSPWTVSESVALAAAQSATVRIENVLVAGALPNVSTAFIEKKLVSLTALTVPVTVPVPAAVWTFGSVLLGAWFSLRRKLAV